MNATDSFHGLCRSSGLPFWSSAHVARNGRTAALHHTVTIAWTPIPKRLGGSRHDGENFPVSNHVSGHQR